ncbi:hypothetical protein T439DRAFT_381120 [Meredithblackwellia eburnea MCA 4105]
MLSASSESRDIDHFPLTSYLAAVASPSAILASTKDHSGENAPFSVIWCNTPWKEEQRRSTVGRGGQFSFLRDASAKELERALEELLGGESGQNSTVVSLSEGDVTITALPSPSASSIHHVVLVLNRVEGADSQLPPPTSRKKTFIDSLPESEMGTRIAQFDWAKTSLGPIESWSAVLQTTVASILTNPYRAYLVWGELDSGVFIYNDAYIQAAQDKHPSILGLVFSEAWSEVWEGLRPVVKMTLEGKVFDVVKHGLPLQRHGVLEETYHSYSFSPVIDNFGRIPGITNINFEVTAEVLTHRRMETVQLLVEKTATARTVPDFCAAALECLSSNPYDLPFFSFYTTEIVDTPANQLKLQCGTASPQGPILKLACLGSVGLPDNHLLRPNEVTVHLVRGGTSDSSGDTPTGIFAWPFELACRQSSPVLVEDISSYTSNLEGRAWGDNSRQGVVNPIWTDGNQYPSAVLVLGLNPRAVYSDAYKSFIQVISRHLGIGLLDVTNAEKEARRTQAMIELDKAKTSFFSSTSHELRTPLSLILGPVDDILSSKSLPGDIRDRLELVSRNSNRLLSMVNKLLDFSSLQEGRTKTVFNPVQLAKFTTELSSLFRDAVERTGLEFVVETEDDPPGALPTYISKELYRTVFFNLLGNAIKFCPSGRITVRLRSTQAEAVLEVEDTGVGIPSDQLSKIFERFHRVENVYLNPSGTGIGLSLTLETVKTLGAEVEVTSVVGEGSTFFIRFRRGYTHLPMEQVSHETIHDGNLEPTLVESELREVGSYRYEVAQEKKPLSSESTEGGASDSNTNSGSSSTDYFSNVEMLDVKNSTIILAEDSTDLRNYIASLLGKHYNVVAVADGQQAFELALRSPPSLVLTDAQMPRMGGEELFKALRGNPATSSIPVVMLSAAAGPESRASALEKGFDDYLVKPFQSRELLARIRVHLTLGKLRAELEARVSERTSELHKSEAQLRELAERYEAITQVSPIGVFMLNSATDIVMVNPRWHEISSHPIDRPYERWAEVVEPDDLPMLVALGDEIKSGRNSGQIQYRYLNGTWVQLEFKRVHEFGPGVAYLGAITDISQQKKLELLHLETLEQRAADAEQHRKQIEGFVDMTSSELRNPLNSVKQNAETVQQSLEHLLEIIERLVRDQSLDTITAEMLSSEMNQNIDGLSAILLCSAHQRRIADDILNVSKVSMGLLNINPRPFNVREKLGDVVRMFDAECLAKYINLTFATDPSLDDLQATVIVADSARLAQVTVNLLSNALRYTAPQGSISITVRASPEVPPLQDAALRVGHPSPDAVDHLLDPVWIEVQIEDSGVGMTRADLLKLFDKFSQVNPRSDQYGGSGLGLYLSKMLIELHHGFIEVESTSGAGSIFRFVIPAERGMLDPGASRGHPVVGTIPRRRSSTTTPSNMSWDPPRKSPIQRPVRQASEDLNKPVHVLVVEDNDINRKVLARQLKTRGYIVSEATDGAKALATLVASEKGDPSAAVDVLLMDIEMPVMGGLEAISILRAREAEENKPFQYGVIAVTGNGRSDLRVEYLKAGFNEMAVKPYNFKDLVLQIEALTGRPATARPL